MKKIIFITITALFLQLTLSLDVAHSETKTKKGKAKISSIKQSITIRYLKAPFEPNIEKIPVPFAGHDIETVYKAFDERKKAEQKDEFESTDQYKQRLSSLSEKPLFASVRQDSILAFVVSPTVTYDADSQMLTINLKTSPVWQSVQIDRSKLGLEIKTGEIRKENSIGQNAYGAKIEIEKLYSKEYELAIHNQSNFETERVLEEYEKKSQQRMAEMRSKYNLPSGPFDDAYGKEAFVQRLKLLPTEARVVKDNVSALIVVKPTSPYITYGAILGEATFKDPNAFFSQMYYVDIDLLEIWLYNKKSGEILIKIKGKTNA